MRFPSIVLVATLLPLAPLLAEDPGPAPLTPDQVTRLQALEEHHVRIIEEISRAYVRIGGGSGVVITPDGVMLTNHHVARQSRDWKSWDVTMPSGRYYYRAHVLGYDSRGDLAVLRLELEEGETVPFCPLGDSDALQVGEEVIALGNPFTLAWNAAPTVSMGVVSALHRYQGGYSDAIQSDCAINPGNSGGPLLNLRGEVVGINGRVATSFGGRWNTGIAYAIPANQIRRFLPQLMAAEGGHVRHGRIIGLTCLHEHNEGAGAPVTQVASLSPAAEAGFHVGDLITAVEGIPAPNYNRVLGLVGTYPAGTEVTVTVRRDGKLQDLRVPITRPSLGALPPDGAPILGVVIDLEDPERNQGLLVEEVLDGYGASTAGLQSDDRILQVGSEKVEQVADLARLVSAAREAGEAAVQLKINRWGNEEQILVPLMPFRGEESLQEP